MSGSDMGNPDLTIIMCAYNEMGRIQLAVEDVQRSLDGRCEEVEIFIVDNMSTDGTREWLANLDLQGVRVILNDHNIGKGGSIKRAFGLSRGRHVVIHDPDMEYRAADIWRLFDLARSDGASLVLGSRVLAGEVRYKYYRNYLGVLLLTWLTNVLYGCRVTDTATAMKLLDGDIARGVSWQCNGFDLDFELVSRIAAMRGRIDECGAEYYPRTRSEGKKIRAVRDGLMALRTILLNRFAGAQQGEVDVTSY